MKHLLLALFLIFSAGSSQAYTSRGHLGCGTYVDDYERNGWEKIANGAWLAGVLTGYNLAMESNVGNGVDISSIELHVYNFCKNNPLKNTAEAATDLIYNLK